MSQGVAMTWQRNYVVLPTGERVRFALFVRPDGGAYLVRFRGLAGTRLERSTGAMKKSDAIMAAHRIILEEYQQVAPPGEQVPWAKARERLRSALVADGKRPATVKGYLETLGKLSAMFPLAKGPADITANIAQDFKER
jgi:hypothetical protein